MRRGAALFFSALALGLCAGCISPPEVKNLPKIEARFGEPAPPKAEKAAPPSAPPPSEREKTVDPPPHRTRDFVQISFKFESEKATWLASEPIRLAEETAATRRFGRFALVAFRGGILVERVYFDFPLLAETSSNSEAIERGLTTKTRVLFPDLARDAELFLVDEKKETQEPVPWRTASPGGAASEASTGAVRAEADGQEK